MIDIMQVRIVVNYLKQINMCYLPSCKKYSLCGLPLNRKYRSHFEIMALMLEALKDGGAPRFSIMRYASINCSQLKKYLRSLTELDFVGMDIRKGRVFYRASEKGQEFLRQYYVLLGMLATARTRSRSADLGYLSEYATPDEEGRQVTPFARKP